MKKSAASQGYHVPTSVQRLTIYAFVGTYLIERGYLTYSLFSEEGSQFEAGDYLYYSFSVLMPAVLILFTYMLSSKRMRRLSRAFEAVLFAFIGTAIWSVITSLPGYALLNTFGDLRPYTYGTSVAFLIIYVLAVIKFNKNRA